MKRMRMWLRELSLAQQLLSIIFIFVAVFAGFIVIFLAPSIQNYAESEMFHLLHNSQENVLYYLKEHPGTVPDLGNAEEAKITLLIYDPKYDHFSYMTGELINSDVQKDIAKKSALTVEGTMDYSIETKEKNSETGDLEKYLYSMTALSDGRSLVSVMNDTYRLQMSGNFLSGTVMINVMFVSTLFVFLMMWIGYIILPLNQIKAYIQKVRNDEPAVLNIKRKDEIGEVAQALVDYEIELARENREKQEMIQNISHDLKTPVATIKSYGEAIKDGIYPYETLEKSVDVIIEHANRLEKKVHSLILLNKMGYLQDTAQEGETLNMGRVVEKVLLSLMVIRPEISFIRDIDEKVCFHGDEEPWRIVVENLVDNALRYAKTNIIIRIREGDLKVINDGKNIPEDKLSTLFKAYEKGNDGQFGLGLSIVYRVCHTYGYHVKAENLTGGVCFHIWKDPVKKKAKNMREKRKNNSQKNAQKVLQ